MTAIVWLRQDLRLADQAAFRAAAADGAVIPLYVLDDEGPGDWRMGGAQRWWLHASLAALDADLRAIGSRLLLRRGPAAETVAAVAAETGADRVHALRHYEPWWREAEAALEALHPCTWHDGTRLHPPEQITGTSGNPFSIYGPYWRRLSREVPPHKPVAAPRAIPAPDRWRKSDTLADWTLLPSKPDWAGGFRDGWMPGEAGAAAQLDRLATIAADYERTRNLPSEEGTSRLSPHLHFGEVSPAQVWHAARGAEKFAKELAWRDFTGSQMLTRPDIGWKNQRPAFDRMAWRDAPEDLRAWQRGRTGYPIVDAGMRQLWHTGWMHNRLRMITASFVVKHLLIDWREGERWFWDTLVDADYGNNSVNWQWIAGSGADASLWSRIMAPLGQSEKFDAGGYIREWVPELRDQSDATIHDPDAHGTRPAAYPAKLIGHREARERALEAGRRMRG